MNQILQEERRNPVVFLISYDENSTSELMKLKNHLDLPQIQLYDKNNRIISLKNVGFVFMGRNLEPNDCSRLVLDDLNERFGWALNFRGRLQDGLKICS